MKNLTTGPEIRCHRVIRIPNLHLRRNPADMEYPLLFQTIIAGSIIIWVIRVMIIPSPIATPIWANASKPVKTRQKNTIEVVRAPVITPAPTPHT